MTITVQGIAEPEALAALAPAWWELWRGLPNATPFQSPAWLLEWWRHFHPGRLYAAAAFAEGGRLVGLAPCYLEHGALGRRILPIGISISDYLDLLLAPEAAEAAGAALLRHYLERADEWDSWELEELRADAAGLGLPDAPELASAVCGQSACPVLDLRAGEALFAIVPSGKARKIRLARNRMERRGAHVIRRIAADEVEAALGRLYAIHTRRWEQRGESGILADERVRAFQRAVAPQLAAEGLLRFHELWAGDRLAGSLYGLHHRDRAYAYLFGFDPDFAFESPGTLLVAHAIEQAKAEGARHFDFLRGQEAYKYGWGAVDRFNQRRSLRPVREPARAAG